MINKHASEQNVRTLFVAGLIMLGIGSTLAVMGGGRVMNIAVLMVVGLVVAVAGVGLAAWAGVRHWH